MAKDYLRTSDSRQWGGAYQLRSERLRVQGWINTAIQKGAKDTDTVDIPDAPGITAPSAPNTPPKVGDTVGGYRFKGGDFNDEKNWEPVQ